jgi:hypothetical protein
MTTLSYRIRQAGQPEIGSFETRDAAFRRAAFLGLAAYEIVEFHKGEGWVVGSDKSNPYVNPDEFDHFQ